MPIFNTLLELGRGRSRTGLLRFDQAVADVRANKANAKVYFIGASTVCGAQYNASSVLQSNTRQFAFPTVAAELFKSCKASHASMQGSNMATGSDMLTLDPRRTMQTGWELWDTESATIIAGRHFFTATSGGSNTAYFGLVPGYEFDEIELVFNIYSGNPGTTLNVDGGTSLGTTTAEGNATPPPGLTSKIFRSSTLYGRSSQIRVVRNGDFTGMHGIIARRSSQKELSFINAGAWGWGTTEWTSATGGGGNGPLASITQAAPVLSVINLGANDLSGGVARATAKTNYTNLVNHCLQYGDVICIKPQLVSSANAGGNNDAQQIAYFNLIDEVAALYTNTRVPVIDTPVLQGGSFAAGSAAGLIGPDDLHITTAFHAIIAAALLDIISPY